MTFVAIGALRAKAGTKFTNVICKFLVVLRYTDIGSCDSFRWKTP